MLSRRIRFHPCDARIKFHRNFGNFYLQVCFLENFELATSVFYSIISNFNYLRLKGCCFFCPVIYVFLLHMGQEITTLPILLNFEKPLETAGA